MDYILKLRATLGLTSRYGKPSEDATTHIHCITS